VLAAAVCIGTASELALLNHTESAVQLVPFALCALGLTASGAGFKPTPKTLLFARIVAVILALGAAFGIWEHFEHNYAFSAEIRPTADMPTLLKEAFFGASPLLAPGGLLIGGALLGLATWRHPMETTP